MIFLSQYIEKCAKTPWEWGIMDCVLFSANWVRECRGVDIASTIRGKYSSALGAQRLIKQNGGFISGIVSHIDTVLNRTEYPVDGDIGIIDAPIGMKNKFPVCGAIMSIHCGGLWVCKSAHGMAAIRTPHSAAWSV